MQVKLSPHAEELVQAALAQGLGRSPEEVIEHALETVALRAPLTQEQKERARRAIEGIRDFRKKHKLTLGPGETIKDLIEEGRRY